MKKPNLFIVGAPKCGTTALYEYLRVHPNIFMPYPLKEPFFFAEYFKNHYSRSRVNSLEEYLLLFKDATDVHIAVGEGSTMYLHSPTAAEKIYNFNREAKIIVMLRNPVEMVYSFHSQLLYATQEDEKDFKMAWELQEKRKNGENLPKTCTVPELLQYAEVGKYGEQIARYLNYFPKKQVKVIIFDEFIRSTEKIYIEILDFLKVPYDGRKEFPPVNESKVNRSAFFTYWLRKPHPVLEGIARIIRNILGASSLGARRMFMYFNSSKRKRIPLQKEFRDELYAEFRGDIEKLQEILGKDLSHWKNKNE